MATKTLIPASDKQVSFIKKLMAERQYGDVYVQTQLDACHVATIEEFSKSMASNVIGVLLNEPKKKVSHAPAKQNVEAFPGFYTDGEKYYEVVQSKQGHKYAKVLVIKVVATCGGCEYCDGEDTCKKSKASWSYAPGAMKNFQQWEKVSPEKATEFGKKWGCCMACGRTLTKTESIEAGIGPICAGKF